LPEPTPDRRYPDRPLVGVGGVVLTSGGDVVLVQRRRDPFAGAWSLPGGALELGETLHEGLAREVREETALGVEVLREIGCFDEIIRDEDGRVRYHYVIVDFLCRAADGVLTAGSDVAAAMAAPPDALERFDLSERVRAAIRRGVALAEEVP
jgi:ADP-ribose pyrophosphatase YjhB (NUDIX family)